MQNTTGNAILTSSKEHSNFTPFTIETKLQGKVILWPLQNTLIIIIPYKIATDNSYEYNIDHNLIGILYIPICLTPSTNPT